MTTKCIWCKKEKADEDFDNPALGVCKDCNRTAIENYSRYLEWKKEHHLKRR